MVNIEFVPNFRHRYVESLAGLKTVLQNLAREQNLPRVYYVGGIFNYITKEKHRNWRDIVNEYCEVIRKFVLMVPGIPIVVQLPWQVEGNPLFRTQLAEVKYFDCHM